MSLADDIRPDGGGDDIVAAEYVLGVLPVDERRQATQRIETEQVFARLVDRWEVYFSPLGVGYAEVEAPSQVKAAIDRRLFAGGGAPIGQGAPAAPGLLSSLAFWRGLAAAALAAFALYIALPFLNPPVEAPQERLVASLAADGSDVRFLAVYDERTNDIGLSRVAGEPAQGSDFELWVIEGQQAPVSLGVIPAGASARLPVSDELRAKMVSGALFAISVEPDGGSTTGAPTGPVVAAGDLKSI
jgi:anti-sigma-K factor RskA